MNKFQQVSGQLIGGNQPLTIQPVESAPRVKRNLRSLEIMSDGNLFSLIATLKTQQEAVRTQRDYVRLQTEIDDLQAELVRRKTAEQGTVVQSPTSEKVDKKISLFSQNVGIGALVFGIIGYMAGAHLNKKPMLFGLAGAVAGGLGTWYGMKLLSKK